MRFARLLLAAVVTTAGVALFSTPNEAEDGHCTTATSAEVRDLCDRYARALQRGDVEALTALYSPDAILMGPAATSIRLGHGEIADYYSTFLMRRPKVAVVERVVRTECGSLGDTGAEAVTLTPNALTPDLAATSRYSMSYARFGSQWLIAHHRQDLPDDLRAEFQPASEKSATIVTGANPPFASAFEVPRVPYSLPNSPPVILSPMRPLLPLIEVVTPIDFAALDTLLALVPKIAPPVVPPVIATQPVPVVMPPIVAAVPEPPPAVAPVAAAAPAVDLAPASVDRRVVEMPSSPHPVFETAGQTPSVPAPSVAPVAVVAEPLPIVPMRMSEPDQRPEVTKVAPVAKTHDAGPVAAPAIPVAPAVAGFTQRATSADVPTPPRAAAVATAKQTPAVAGPQSGVPESAKIAPAAALPKRVSLTPKTQSEQAVAARPAPVQTGSASVRSSLTKAAKDTVPVKSGKFLRWEESTPIFDD